MSTTYLFWYNTFQALGWFYVLYQSIQGILLESSLSGAMPASGSSVSLFQFISSMEILHALIGIVRGSPAAALLQWTGRANVLYAVILAIPEITSSKAAGAMVIAWAVSEVIRYPWYAAQLTGQCPFWLTWLRYTMFIPLYPIGVLGEIISIYNALPVLEERKMYSIEMPNAFNFSFSYAIFMKVILGLYPILWWQLYSMLLRQRSKRLSSSTTKKMS